MNVDYINLSNGLFCPHVFDLPNPRYVRIQSTWCEQKRWGDILTTLGADMYYNLAQGRLVIVHDMSEKNRESRACWQGLSWIRYACSVAWGLPEPTEYSRSGANVTPYWRECWNTLTARQRKAVEYFDKYRLTEEIHLTSCWRHVVVPAKSGMDSPLFGMAFARAA